MLINATAHVEGLMNRLRQPLMASARVTRRRSTPLVAVLIVFVLAALAGPAAAQWGGFGYRRGGYASTASQGAAYGMSEMMRAQGYENLQNSEAAKNWEDVKTLDIQNKMRWTETYFEMRKTNREARAAEAGPAITHDQAIRMAKMGAPPRLVSTQLDPITGHIEYPMVLQDDIFAPYREELDKLFAKRASSGGSISFNEFEEIQSTVANFTEALKEHVNKYPAGEYGRARTFLDSLRHEASLPSG
jgi:hypothetical protein